MAEVGAETKATLEEVRRSLRPHLPELSERYHVKYLGVFGSYVRAEQEGASDLDILVEFHEVPSLLTFVRLERELADLVGIEVDLVMKEALKPGIGERILNEVVAV